MKKTLSKISVLLLSVIIIFSFASCQKDAKNASLWEGATYTEDTALGEGEKEFALEFSMEDKVITFTVHTDKETVGDALLSIGLISGDAGEYGLYVKVVNGITADYETTGSYWSFLINGEMAMTGVDGAKITEGEIYRLEYTK